MPVLLPAEKEFVQTLGRVIRQARLEMNLTQGELAEKSGLSVTTLWSMEKGDGDGVSLARWVAVLSVTGYLHLLQDCLMEHAYNPFQQTGKKRIRRKGRGTA